MKGVLAISMVLLLVFSTAASATEMKNDYTLAKIIDGKTIDEITNRLGGNTLSPKNKDLKDGYNVTFAPVAAKSFKIDKKKLTAKLDFPFTIYFFDEKGKLPHQLKQIYHVYAKREVAGNYTLTLEVTPPPGKEFAPAGLVKPQNGKLGRGIDFDHEDMHKGEGQTLYFWITYQKGMKFKFTAEKIPKTVGVGEKFLTCGTNCRETRLLPEGIEIGGKVFLIVDPQFAKMLSTGNVARKGTYEELEGLTASASASDVPIGIRAKAKKSQKKVASTETYSITPFIVQALFFKLSASMSYDFGNSFYDGYDINTENSFEFKSDVIAEGGLLQPLQPEGTGYRFVGQTGQVIASKFTIKQEEGGWRIFCLQEDQRRDLNIIGDVGGVMCYVSNSRIDQNTPKFPSPFNRFKVEAYRTGPQDA